MIAAAGARVDTLRDMADELDSEPPAFKAELLKQDALGGHVDVMRLPQLRAGVTNGHLTWMFDHVMNINIHVPLVKILHEMLPAENVQAVLSRQKIEPLLWLRAIWQGGRTAGLQMVQC